MATEGQDEKKMCIRDRSMPVGNKKERCRSYVLINVSVPIPDMERIGAKNHLRPWSLHSIPGTYPWLYYIDSAFCISLLSQNRFASVVCSCCSSASSLTLLVTF